MSPERFEREFKTARPKLYAHALRMTRGNRELAEDIVQQTAVRAFRSFDKYSDSYPFVGWCYRILVNQMRDEVRNQERRIKTVQLEESIHGEPVGEMLEFTNGVAERLQEALRTYAGPCDETTLDVLINKGSVDAAKVSGQSGSMIRTRVYRLRQHLRRTLAPLILN